MKYIKPFTSIIAASALSSCATKREYVEPRFVLTEETYSAEGHKRTPHADKPEYLDEIMSRNKKTPGGAER